MARPPRNELAVKSLADAVGKLRKQHTKNQRRAASTKDIELFAWRDLEMRVSEESIRKAFNGQIDPTTCNIELLVTLARYFEVSPDELGSFAAERIRRILVLTASGGPDGGGDVATAKSRCTAQPSPVEVGTVLPMRWHQPHLDQHAA